MSIFTNTDSIPNAQFVGSKKCANCHPNQFKDWKNSHHEKSMQKADSLTVIAPFNNEIFKSNGVTSTFYKKDKHFYVNTEGPDGLNHEYKIIYTFGVSPLQQYIVQFPNGHYQCLRTAFNTQKNKWFDLYPDFKIVHSEWLHWSRGGLNWNTMCADCHSTNVKKNYNEETHSYTTNFANINVSCEACHGPGKKHVQNALKEDYQKTDDLQMTNLNSKQLVDACARCHSRRENLTLQHTPQGTFLDHYYPQLITDNVYYPDGQILDEDYVYGSFVQSKMYHHGVSCKDCHNVHSNQLKFTGNKLCTQCHTQQKYDTQKHHKHSLNSKGSACINCHMPGKFYMGNDFRRDHSFRIPRPDLSVQYNTPNACTNCHQKEGYTWAQQKFVELYGAPKKNHFSDKLIPGITQQIGGKDSLISLAKNKEYPNIARASAIYNLYKYNTTNVKNVISFLQDDSPLVRAATIDVLQNFKNNSYTHLFPLLKDTKRAVRIKTFSTLSALPLSKIPKEYLTFYKKGSLEFKNYLKTTSDFSSGKLKQAQYYTNKGNYTKAITILEKALELDPLNNIVRTSIAQLYYQTQQFSKAEKSYQTILNQEPGFGLTNYNYGLLLNELQRPKEAIIQLEKAIKYLPNNNRIAYNLALLYFNTHKVNKSISFLEKQLQTQTNNIDLTYLLSFFYYKNKEYKKSKILVIQLLNKHPNHSQYIELYQSILEKTNT